MSNHAHQQGTSAELETVVHGRHAEMSARFKQHVNDKLAKITRFSIPIHRIDVEVSHEANPRQHDRAYEVELTCHGSGQFLRAEAHAEDKYTALDLAYARLEERLRRMHDRAKSVKHQRIAAPDGVVADMAVMAEAAVESEPDDGILLESGPLVVRTKHIEAHAMTIEEAVEAMEQVGHDFFLFKNIANGLSSVIYRRRGYDFGVVQLAG